LKSKKEELRSYDHGIVRARSHYIFFANAGLYYSGVWDCIKKVVRKDGILAGWKGAGPALMRMAPMDAITWAVTEQLRIFFNTHID
jgi:hypothetical protein